MNGRCVCVSVCVPQQINTHEFAVARGQSYREKVWNWRGRLVSDKKKKKTFTVIIKAGCITVRVQHAKLQDHIFRSSVIDQVEAVEAFHQDFIQTCQHGLNYRSEHDIGFCSYYHQTLKSKYGGFLHAVWVHFIHTANMLVIHLPLFFFFLQNSIKFPRSPRLYLLSNHCLLYHHFTKI